MEEYRMNKRNNCQKLKTEKRKERLNLKQKLKATMEKDEIIL